MAAKAIITGSTSFRPESDPETENVDVLALPGRAEFSAETDTVAQVRIDADDGVTGDPQEVVIALMEPTGVFTVSPMDEEFTDAAHGLADGDEVRVSSSGTLPDPLEEGVSYYVIFVDANTFKLSETVGGSAIDITDTGSGTHSWQKYGRPEISYAYPTTGPAVPVTIKSNRDGGNNDFTRVKGLQILLVPTNREGVVKGTFTVDTGTNVITTSGNHLRAIGQRIRFESTATLPAGLEEGTDYYVLTVPSGTTLTVSETPGGATVDITDTGSGTHSWRTIGDAYGEVWLTMGDSADKTEFVHVPLKLDHTAGDLDATFWAGSIPPGLLYDPSNHLTVRINDSTPPSDNLTVLVNLLGN